MSKKLETASKKIDKKHSYSIDEAANLLKSISFTKFPASVELAVHLNVDPEKAEQQLRGNVTLPHGTGKTKRVLVVTTTKEEEAKSAGADFVGDKEIIMKIKSQNWFDYDVILATPEMMLELGKIGKILGPKGLMPNAKDGTLTTDIGQTIRDLKKGKTFFRTDKEGNIHVVIATVDFPPANIAENYNFFMKHLVKLRPHTVKGHFIKTIFMSPTMGPSIPMENNFEK